MVKHKAPHLSLGRMAVEAALGSTISPSLPIFGRVVGSRGAQRLLSR
jgi:hypothetical protein